MITALILLLATIFVVGAIVACLEMGQEVDRLRASRDAARRTAAMLDRRICEFERQEVRQRRGEILEVNFLQRH
jgi:cell division protein ZapA (FtsZ GTPase activity inhibitor)